MLLSGMRWGWRALVVVAFLVNAGTASAEEQVWAGNVAARGGQSLASNLVRGERYVIVVTGTVYFGRWHADKRRRLQNDACYEFNAKGYPDPLPILRTNIGVTVCRGRYKRNHEYRSRPFVFRGNRLRLWIVDSDYRDNGRTLNVRVLRIPRPFKRKRSRIWVEVETGIQQTDITTGDADIAAEVPDLDTAGSGPFIGIGIGRQLTRWFYVALRHRRGSFDQFTVSSWAAEVGLRLSRSRIEFHLLVGLLGMTSVTTDVIDPEGNDASFFGFNQYAGIQLNYWVLPWLTAGVGATAQFQATGPNWESDGNPAGYSLFTNAALTAHW